MDFEERALSNIKVSMLQVNTAKGSVIGSCNTCYQ